MSEALYINDELLVKYLLDETSAAETEAVEQWLQQEPANRRYFEELISTWEKSKTLHAVSSVPADLAWERFSRRVAVEKPAPVIPVNRNRSWLRIAALFIVMAGIALLGYIIFTNGKEPQQLAVNSGDTVLTDTLPDGSVITLNKNSSLSYPESFKGNQRPVKLQGEAFFSVKPDSKKPFEVIVNDVRVVVLGTSFNIKSVNGITEVIVETGLVRVIRGQQSVELRPRQKIVISKQDSLMVPKIEEEQLYNHYRSREFVCDNTPLWKLVSVLNEAYDVQITIERDELKNLPLDVTFSNESIDVILDIIRETFNSYNIQVLRQGNNIILR